jgi:hypothetical protein
MVDLQPPQPTLVTIFGVGYLAGTEVSVAAIPFEGYVFHHWSGELSGSAPQTSIVMNQPMTITATFIRSDAHYTITVDAVPDDSGKVTLNPPPPAGGYAVSKRIALTATASAGFRFSHWEGDMTGSTNPTSTIVEKNKRVTAIFDAVYPLRVSLDPSLDGGGRVVLEPSQPDEGYVDRTAVTLTAIAPEGYEFDHWSGTISGSQNPTTITITSAAAVTAHFTKPHTFHAWWILLPLLLLSFTLLAGLAAYRLVKGPPSEPPPNISS